MQRRTMILGLTMASLAACAPAAPLPVPVGPDGQPVQRIYRISEADAQEIPFRMLDGVNTLRRAAGRGPLQLDAQLTAAAATHSRDMAVQNRPWHFGSNGSSPLDRVRRVGFSGQLIGETISETYENETETLAAWMQQPDTRTVILDPNASRMGVAWLQEPAGKIWWTMVLGA
jgi:uncharacterized protein YkwD